MSKLECIELKNENGRISTKKYKIYNVLKNDQVVAYIEQGNYSYDGSIFYSANTISEYGRGDHIGRYDTMIEARVSVSKYLLDNISKAKKVKAQYLPFDENNEFYPTPSKIAGMMLSGIDWRFVETILEPTAGKGDLAEYARKASNGNGGFHHKRDNLDIDCIEIDKNLQHLLRGEGYKVIHDNFLTFNGKKKYDIILMNPPFSCGDKHLLKALDIQKNGGSVICLLNAETIKNPYSNTRKLLVDELKRLDAKITYVNDAFSSKVERKASVDVAIVKVCIPTQEVESEIYERMKKAEGQVGDFSETTAVNVSDFFEAMIRQYNVEVNASQCLYKSYTDEILECIAV